MRLIGWGKRHDAQALDLRNAAVRGRFRFQVKCHGLAAPYKRWDLQRLGRGRVQMSDLAPELKKKNPLSKKNFLNNNLVRPIEVSIVIATGAP